MKATEEEIKEAYHKKQKEPDMDQEQLDMAYDTLIDSERKKEYNMLIQNMNKGMDSDAENKYD